MPNKCQSISLIDTLNYLNFNASEYINVSKMSQVWHKVLYLTNWNNNCNNFKYRCAIYNIEWQVWNERPVETLTRGNETGSRKISII